MSGLEPFTPDRDYCVYCHAPAAGMCAECGALCCVDCVELVMGWTTQRATCSSCLAQAEPAPPPRHRRLAIGCAIALGAVAMTVLWWR